VGELDEERKKKILLDTLPTSVDNYKASLASLIELELIQTHMVQTPMLRVEGGKKRACVLGLIEALNFFMLCEFVLSP